MVDGVSRLKTTAMDGEWKTHSVSVSAGIHRFKWIYFKDGSMSSGTDQAYVRSITVSNYTLHRHFYI